MTKRLQFFFIVAIAFLCGCEDINSKEEKYKEQLIGNWKLIETSVKSDSPFVNYATLHLKDGAFQSNVSFFWNIDSAKKHEPLSGYWYVEGYVGFNQHFYPETYYQLVFQVDTNKLSMPFSVNGDSLRWFTGDNIDFWTTSHLWRRYK